MGRDTTSDEGAFVDGGKIQPLSSTGYTTGMWIRGWKLLYVLRGLCAVALPSHFVRADADGDTPSANALTCPNVNYECWTSNGGLGGAHVIGCCSASSIDVYGSIVPDGCLYETACYDSADYLAICTTAPYSCADDVSLRLWYALLLQPRGLLSISCGLCVPLESLDQALTKIAL